MEFNELLNIVGKEPIFHTGLLLAGEVDPGHIRRQLVRWMKAGKLYQLRRGIYALAPPYQQTRPHPFLVANHLIRPSYISLQSALDYYGLIPEFVQATTCVTTARPKEYDTPLDSYTFRHIKTSRFLGFELEEVSRGQRVYLATPEKALLDLVYFQKEGDSLAFLRSLRLQNLNRLQSEALQNLAASLNSPKLERAAENILSLAEEEKETYEDLPQAAD